MPEKINLDTFIIYPECLFCIHGFPSDQICLVKMVPSYLLLPPNNSTVFPKPFRFYWASRGEKALFAVVDCNLW